MLPYFIFVLCLNFFTFVVQVFRFLHDPDWGCYSHQKRRHKLHVHIRHWHTTYIYIPFQSCFCCQSCLAVSCCAFLNCDSLDHIHFLFVLFAVHACHPRFCFKWNKDVLDMTPYICTHGRRISFSNSRLSTLTYSGFGSAPVLQKTPVFLPEV